MSTSIIWQSQDANITLIDIPGSIAAAQGSAQRPFRQHLVSSEPLRSPYPSNEPKSAAARAKLAGNTVDEPLHAEYRTLLESALQEIGSHHPSEWCLDRPAKQERPRAAKKRKLGDWTETTTSLSLDDFAADGTVVLEANDDGARMILTKDAGGEGKTVVTQIDVDATPPEEAFCFRMPPNSHAVLGDCSDADALHAALSSQPEGHRSFDFILMDPPWPNRSVRRSRKTAGSTYETVSTLEQIKELLLGTQLDRCMSDDCLIGVWITNKPAIRESVSGADGLFDQWGIHVTEEWIWLKTTTNGEPVTQLDALWRKPYEVLVLGRRRKDQSRPAEEITPPRRVIVGVPDLHSRKPCLKELIEPLMPCADDYRALELFSRHLASGWWSWGNECIKFNAEDCWRDCA